MLTLQHGLELQIATKAFASGGEGEVYHIISPKSLSNQIVKLFKPSKRTPEREEKMKYMLANPPAHLQDTSNAVVWIKELVYHDGKFAGYTMPMAQGVKLEYLCGSKVSKSIGKEFQKYDFKCKEAHFWRLKLAFNLSVALAQIHKTDKYVMVDLKPDNIMVQPNGKVSLIDMDSIQVIENQKVEFAASAHTPEFAPWEKLNIGKDLIPETWDRFGLAIILYKLLFGIHPFTGSCKAPFENCNNVEQLIEHGLFPFLKGEHFEVVPPPHKRFLASDLDVQMLFKKCFDKETTAENRPTALEWCECLLPYARMVLNTSIIEEEKPKKKDLELKKVTKNKNAVKRTWFGLKTQKKHSPLPFQVAKISWWQRFSQIQNHISPEFIMLFILTVGGLGGISANYVASTLKEIEMIENQRQYDIFAKDGQRFLEAKDTKNAFYAFSNALKFKPHDSFADSQLRALQREISLKAGENFYYRKQYAEAVAEYDEALDAIPHDSLVLAKRADAIFASAMTDSSLITHFDIKLKIKKLPDYLYANCANEIFISANDLGQHFQPIYEVEGAKLIEKEKKGRITLIPTADKVTFKLKNDSIDVKVFEFRVVNVPLPHISVTPFWKGSFESPFLRVGASASANFSAYYSADAVHKVTKWKCTTLKNGKPIKSIVFSKPTISLEEVKANILTEDSDKLIIEILEIQRRNYEGKFEIIHLKNIKTKFTFNQYLEEI
jgi:serine/threonine protein kinase